jgi:hypothetical protein
MCVPLGNRLTIVDVVADPDANAKPYLPVSNAATAVSNAFRVGFDERAYS